jgi:hypothetical protein
MLGHVYNNYDAYNMQLVQVSNSITSDGDPIIPLTNQLTNIYMSGLNFGNLYETKYGNTNEPLLTTLIIKGDEPQVYEPTNSILTLEKIRNNLNNVNLTFTMKDFISDDVKTDVLPDTTFSFIIYGVN